MNDYLVRMLESYDDKQLKRMILSLDILGKPLFSIFDGLPDPIAQSVVSILDMIQEFTVGGELNRAYNYKKGLRCYEELYHLYHEDHFMKNFTVFQEKNGFFSEEDESVPMINEDGTIERMYKYVNIKWITPGFGKDQEELDLRMQTYQDFIKSMIPGDYHVRADKAEPIFGPVTAGRYERGLEGFRIRFVFKT